jgi:hypothetical protein
VDDETEKVLRAFVRDGRIVAIPARAAKRRLLLEYVAGAFEPGVRYTEREVDAVLRAFHEPDWVSLRRYLIDEDLMARRDGWYWRIGGYVDVS